MQKIFSLSTYGNLMPKKISDKIVISEASEEHLDEIIGIERVSSSNPWRKGFFKSELKTANSNFKVAICEDDGCVAGFIVFRDLIDSFEINNIAVKKEFRRMGIGGMMLNYMFERAKKKNISKIFLEVRESNTSAYEFYRKFGFSIMSKRKSYYHKPSEDAIVMKKSMESDVKQ